MPGLEIYDRALPYSYAPGVFPALVCLERRPQCVRRLLIHSQSDRNEGVRALARRCEAQGVRVESADRVLRRISGKDNCYAAIVFEKTRDELEKARSHVVLHHPSDMGNLGTILRSLLGFGLIDLAVIRPAADPFDPRVVRASMGALFGLRLREYEDFEAYRAEHPDHALYPFMLDASVPLDAAVRDKRTPYALVFGNEASGLPADFAQMGRPVRIAHSADIDSLNLAVAVSIAAYAFTTGEGEGTP